MSKNLKKITTLILLLIISICLLTGCGKGDGEVLYLYNWGEYIADGSYGMYDCISGFEEYYEELTGKPIKIYLTTYPSNEDMYTKIAGGTSEYDVICPSDYMIERMISEGLLQKFDLESTCAKYGAECYYKYIGQDFRGLYYDPTSQYSVPYTYGRVGIIYNKILVDEADCSGWEIMWNPKYSGQILQFNNLRDAFGTVQYMEGLDVNSEEPAEWQYCQQKLLEQKPIIQSYVMDEIYNKLESGEAALGAYYAGDFFTMQDVNEDLAFFYPEETNAFVDALCIPASAQNPEAAALFINFMLSAEPAIATAEFIYYASPNELVFTDPGYIDYMGADRMEILYPEGFNMHDQINKYAYKNLSPETMDMAGALWESLKISGGLPAHIYIIAGLLLAAIIAVVCILLRIQCTRRRYY